MLNNHQLLHKIIKKTPDLNVLLHHDYVLVKSVPNNRKLMNAISIILMEKNWLTDGG